jgi:hypothetical protein
MMTRSIVLLGVALAGCAMHAAADPTVTATAVLGPFTGHDAKLHPDNLAPNRIEYYGTDLGFSYEHQGQVQFLFGDTWAIETYAPIQKSTAGRYDDSFGSVDLGAYRDPGRFTPNNIPLIKLGQNPGTTETAAINPGHAMDLGKTPMAGFSNGAREFGIFNVTKPKGCRADAECSNGLVCDAGLGFAGSKYTDEMGLTLACVDGDPGCNADTMTDADAAPAPQSGFCTDRTTTIWADTPAGRVSGVALMQRVGMRSLTDHREYTDIREWLTSKFVNMIARTVNDFAPDRISSRGYRVASGSGTRRRVFLWGRPGFIGVSARKRTLGVYFAYVDLPIGPGFAWQPHYYTGRTDAGVPQFSSNEIDAAALDLDSTTAGIQSAEIYDTVNQMSVAWVDPLKKWVMFYGGGLTKLPTPPFPHCGVLEVFAGHECQDVVIGNGAVRMRTADNPWGPWTPPQDVVVGGDPAVPGSGLYSAGGVLRHPACTAPGCATPSRMPFYHPDEYGFLYSANVIDPWIKRSGTGVDIIWNASTWDPYRVALFRTHIDR